MGSRRPPLTCDSAEAPHGAPHSNREDSTFGERTDSGGVLSAENPTFARPADTSTHQGQRQYGSVTRQPEWGSGMTYQECMNQSLTNYGPRTGQRWIGSTYSDLYLCTGSTHGAPSLSSPPSIPDREVTDVTLTVSSSDAFTEVEHYYQCENSDADSVSSDIENSVVASTTGTSVTWQDVPAGAGDAECYRDEPVLYYVRVRSTNTPWSEWQSASGSITASTNPVHLAPSLGSASHGSVPYGTETRFTAIATSTEAFDRIEYKSFCYQRSGGSVTSGTGRVPPFSPAVLRRTVAWDVTTGDDDGECYSTSGIQFYVRVKSDSTAWSDDIYESIPVTTPPTTSTQHLSPSINTPSLSEIPFGETTRFTATVTSTQVFDRIEYKSFCQQHSGGSVTSGTGRVPSFSPTVSSRIVAWSVTTGDDDGECYSNSGIQFYVRVKSASTTWSNWVYIRRSVVDPTQHLPPLISGPSLLAIPFGETTRFTATATSAEAFDELEYGYSCQQLDGDNVAPDAAPLGPFDPAVLTRIVAWNVTTGDNNGECHSNSGIQFYVRVKSDSTAWSDDIYELIPVTAPPTTSTQHLPPSINTPSLSEIPFGETTRFTATVTSTQVFDRIEYKSFCQQHSGGGVTSETGHVPPLEPFDPAVSSRTVAWSVTTGDDDGECYSTSGIQFYVRVKSASTTWSIWVHELIPVTTQPPEPLMHEAPVFGPLPTLLNNGTQYPTITVSAGDAFTETEHHYFCNNQQYRSTPVPTPPFTSTNSKNLTWTVATGTGGTKCNLNISEYVIYVVRVKSATTDWSDPVYKTGHIVTPPTAPTGVTAKGDSRGVPGTGPQGTGRSRLVWDDVPGSTMYQVQYRAAVSADWEYHETTTNRAIITGLDLNTVYILQVQTFKRALSSDWSLPSIYTYPTKTPPTAGTLLLTQRYMGWFMLDAHYSYTLCEDTLPADERPEWISLVEDSIAIWESVTDGMVTDAHRTVDCGPLGSAERNVRNTVKREPESALRTLYDDDCNIVGIIGCAAGLSAQGHRLVRIGFLDTLSKNQSKCVVVHEAGHAFGLDHTTLSTLTSVMVSDAGLGLPPCSNVPHPVDIVLIKALYQSR